jgi:hypothetical protein
MDKRTKPKALGGGGTGAGLLWGAYSTVTTPEDAGWLAHMLAEPPVYLPWLVAAIGIVVIIWAFFWPSEDEVPDASGNSTTGNDSPIILQTNSGGGHNIGQLEKLIVGHQRFEMAQDEMNRVLAEIDKSKEVVLMWAETPRSEELAMRLDEFLRRNRVTVTICGASSFKVKVSVPLGVYPDGIKQGELHINPDEQCVFVDAAL